MNLRKNKKADWSAKQGFTLVELLLVMAIIGILAAVIFAAISPARQRARLTNFKEQMNSINTAATMCVDAGGTINTSLTPGGSNDICTPNGGSKMPAMKSVDNGAALANTMTVANEDNEDYVITLFANTGEHAGTNCRGVCNIEGCKFPNCN